MGQRAGPRRRHATAFACAKTYLFPHRLAARDPTPLMAVVLGYGQAPSRAGAHAKASRPPAHAAAGPSYIRPLPFAGQWLSLDEASLDGTALLVDWASAL
jgi:hypothetical protein